MNRLQGKVAFVTGGAQRAGRAICELFGREGAAVAVTDVAESAGEAVAEAIRKEGGRAKFWRLDVSKEAEVERVMSEVTQAYGRLDVLVNNAAIGGTDHSTHEVTETEWDAVMAVDVKGAFFCTKHAVPHMRHVGAGSIVNIGSIYGIVGSPHFAPLHASKGALRIMTKTDALAYASDRIRVNAVHPGFIWTPDEQTGGGDSVNVEMAHEETTKRHPLEALGEAIDVAYGVLYFASDEAKFVTGSELVIDGGYTAR